jgi:hypothetical protein
MATKWVAQSSAGSADGTSASNAYSIAQLNAASPYSPAAGDTVVLSGTITTKLVIPTSGSAGNIITYQFDTGAKFSTARWATGAIGSTQSYITIDGGTNGIIEATGNGTARATQLACIGINITGGSNITIKNLLVRDMYVRTPGSAELVREGQGIVVQDITGGLLIENCTVTEGDTMIAFVWSLTSTNWIVRDCVLSRCNHGIFASITQNNVVITNPKFYRNRVSESDIWEGHPDLHLNCIFIACESPAAQGGDYTNGGTAPGLEVYSNYIGPEIGFTNTAAIFIPDQGWRAFANCMVYNNLFTSDSGTHWNNGCIAVSSNGALVANNTYIAGGGGGTFIQIGQGSASTTGMIIKNNLGTNIGTGIYCPQGGIASCDYNVFHYESGTAENTYPPGGYYSMATWTAATGFDVHTSTSLPSLDASNVPTSGDTVAKDHGTDLSAYFTTDKNGNTRTGTWDIGAFEYGAGGGDVTAPTPNPATFASVTADSTTQITAVATTASDETALHSTPYDFSINGVYQGYQASRTKVFTGLIPNTSYAFKTRIKDAAGNVTTESSTNNTSTQSVVTGTARSARKASTLLCGASGGSSF